MYIVIHDSLLEISAQQWNKLLPSNNPFMRHEFLYGLEKTACVSTANGWQSSHIAAYKDKTQDQLIAAMPCYIKSHSYGEYIFDWAWANAYHQYNIDYYPKLSNAVPFTPATGERWLCDKNYKDSALSALLDAAAKLIKERNLSSFHSLFLTQNQCNQFKQANYLIRESSQFHWQNNNYQSFADFTASMNSRKRKNINRERRRITDSQITYRWFHGDQIKQKHAKIMHSFYLTTVNRYGAQAYLNSDFFDYLSNDFKEQTMFLFAYHDEKIIAGGLYFKSNDTLYGRYWGALDNYHSVHFETCYYQAIEWCIENKFKRFEAGAQGEHKLSRGLTPTTTYSAHWIENPQFRTAIEQYIKDEQEQVSGYTDELIKHSPFRKEV